MIAHSMRRLPRSFLIRFDKSRQYSSSSSEDTTKAGLHNICEKYEIMLQKTKEERSGPQEVCRKTPFGDIRFDDDNKHLEIFGVDEVENQRENLVDEQYFQKNDTDTSKSANNVLFTSDPKNFDSHGSIDKQYLTGDKEGMGITRTVLDGFDFSFQEMEAFSLSDCMDVLEKDQAPIKPIPAEELRRVVDKPITDEEIEERVTKLYKKVENFSNVQKNRHNQIKRNIEKKHEAKAEKIVAAASPAPLEVPKEITSSIDAVRALRQTDVNNLNKLKPFERILEGVPSLHKWLKHEVVGHLHKNKIFENDELLAFNKPYGLTTKMMRSKSKIFFLIDDLLPDLAQLCNQAELFPVNRPDLDVSGILIFAKSKEGQDRLKDLMKKNKIEYTYISIIKGSPKYKTGIIDMPVGECIERYDHMGVTPDVEGYTNAVRRAKTAVTKYEILSFANGMSVLELVTHTDVKHQIRVHCAEVLECAITGDHKYDNHGDKRPQVLPGEALGKLGASRSQARKLPLFLHIQGMCIPGPNNNTMVEIRTKPPLYFYRAFKSLQLGMRRNRISKRALAVIFPEELEQ